MRASSAFAASDGTTCPTVPSTPTMASSSATGTCRKRGVRPSNANNRSPCCRGVIASPGPPIGSTRSKRARVVQAVGEIVGEVVVGDRLARGQRAVAEHQERLAAAHALDLSRQRLEERGRPHDRLGQPRRDQHVLERELRVLERESRLLHAQRRQLHDLRHAGVARDVERLHMRRMVDRPRVGRRAGARREARHQRVEAFAGEAVALQRRADRARRRSARSRRPAGARCRRRTRGRPTPARGRTRHTTSWPRRTSARTVARPIVPVAPRTKTRRGFDEWSGDVTVAGSATRRRAERTEDETSGPQRPTTSRPGLRSQYGKPPEQRP